MQFKNYQQSILNRNRTAKQTRAKKKTSVVFATHKFMGQKLTEMEIVFCGLPYATL